MASNFLGPPGKSLIRVSYVDPKLGLVENVSLTKANDYACKNPGTTFIFRDGDNNLRYLNINEVNKLTPADLSRTDPCNAKPVPCGVPKVIVSGGSGIGAAGNPIVSRGGSIIAVDVVSGGYGYKSEPNAFLVDACDIGSGAVLRTRLGREPNLQQFFDEIEECNDKSSIEKYYQDKYDLDGNLIGKFDPVSFFGGEGPAGELDDPIQKEISEYEKSIRTIKNPWWTTRSSQPGSITVGTKSLPRVYSVTMPGRRRSMIGFDDSPGGTLKPNQFGYANDYKAARAQGFSDQDIRYFLENDYKGTIGPEMKKKLENPNWGKLNPPGIKSMVGFDDSPGSQTKPNQFGYANDYPAAKAQGFTDADVRYFLENDYKGAIGPDMKKKLADPNWGKYSKQPLNVWSDFMDTYAISPVPPSNVPGSDFAGQQFVMRWLVDFPHDGEYIFKGSCDNIGNLYVDQENVMALGGFTGTPTVAKKSVKKGTHLVRIDLLNKEQYENFDPIKIQSETTGGFTNTDMVEVEFTVFGEGGPELPNLSFVFTSEDKSHSFTLKGVSKNRESRKEKVNVKANTVYTVESKEGSKKWKYVEQGLVKNGIKDKELKEGSGNKIFADYIGSANDNDDLQITAGSGLFTSSNRRKSAAGKRNTYDLKFKVSVSESSQQKPSKPTPPGIKSMVGFDDSPGGATKPNQFGYANDYPAAKNQGFSDADIRYYLENEYRGTIGPDMKEKLKDPKFGRLPTESDVTLKINPKLSSTFQNKSIFNTIDYINKADRKLWRTNVFGRGGFANEYGVCPFDTTKQLDDNPYAGTHVIRWENIEFPVDGIYTVTIGVDDNVTLYIGNSKSGGRVEDGSGLKSRESGGDEIIIRKEGFKNPSTPNPVTPVEVAVKAGKYRIRAELEQIPGGKFGYGAKSMIGFDDSPGSNTQPNQFGYLNDYPAAKKQGFTDADIRYYLENDYKGIIGPDMKKKLADPNFGRLADVKGLNPMVLAIDIKVKTEAGPVISAKSWNENPMGAAVTIEAPPVPIPQEKFPPQGVCPKNPIWSTRHPGASSQWYPVEIPQDKGGNPYLNRYTMSPVPPLDTPNSDGAGIVWSNTWKVNIPYKGKYRIDGARRAVGRIKIDGKVVTGLTGVYTEEAQKWVEKNFAGWDDPKTNTVKVGRKSTYVNLTKGEHEITVEVVGIPETDTQYVKKMIFSSIKSINQASIPLYHYPFSGWSKFLNTYGVTPCSKAEIKTQTSAPAENMVEVEFDVYGEGGPELPNLSFAFTSKDKSHSFILKGVSKNKETRKEKVKVKPNTVYDVVAKEGSKKWNYVEQGLVKNGIKNKELKEGGGNKIFADYIGSANDNDDLQITAGSGLFLSSNRRKSAAGKRNTYDLTFKVFSDQSVGIATTTTTSSQTNNIKQLPVGVKSMVGFDDSPGSGTKPNQFGYANDYPAAKAKGFTDVDIRYFLENDYKGIIGPEMKKKLQDPNFGRLLLRIENQQEFVCEGTFSWKWEKINFPENGTYIIEMEADDGATLKIGGREITKVEIGKPTQINAILAKGLFDVEVTLTNKEAAEKSWEKNPTALGLTIKYNSPVQVLPSGIKSMVGFDDSPGGELKSNQFGYTNDYQVAREQGFTNADIRYFLENDYKGAIGPLMQEKLADPTWGRISPPGIKSMIGFDDSPGAAAKPNQFGYENDYRVARDKGFSDSDIRYFLENDYKGTIGPEMKKKLDNPNWGRILPPGIKSMLGYDDSPGAATKPNQFGFDNDYPSARAQGFSDADIRYFLENDYRGTIGPKMKQKLADANFGRIPTGGYYNGSSWKNNPIGISAALIAPPCPKPGGGVGIVTEIYPIVPGNGYKSPPGGGGYNVAIEIVDIIPSNPGLGYTPSPVLVNGNPGICTICEVGPNGEVLKICCTPTVIEPEWPTIIGQGGFNLVGVPVLKPVRDPLNVPPEKLIQVVDLVGLRQTGYVNGRAYYGAVFVKDGITYAGYYETAGDLVQVYATLQESIDAQVTTPASAIQRSGTEVNSNNPQLNIPNTPESGTPI